jgi:hypothetical protein
VNGRLRLAGAINHKAGSEGGETRINYKTLDQLDDIARRLRWD